MTVTYKVNPKWIVENITHVTVHAHGPTHSVVDQECKFTSLKTGSFFYTEFIDEKCSLPPGGYKVVRIDQGEVELEYYYSMPMLYDDFVRTHIEEE